MLNRRKFLSNSLLSSAAIGLGMLSCDRSSTTASATRKSRGVQTAEGPLVIATWPNTGATGAAAAILGQGGAALNAVEAGARFVEADPDDMSVGYGGRPDRDGRVTLDACIMDHDGRAGSVACLEHIKHPVSVARKVMEETPHVMLTGSGALQFALAQGFQREDLLTPEARRQWEAWLTHQQYQPEVNVERHDTIGLLALDRNGRLAGACTTSGMAYKMHGRVGDSPIIGAGLYVDGEVGAACATGLGEYVLTTLGSFLVVELMRQGKTPQEACREAVERLVKKIDLDRHDPYQVGFIALSPVGEWGAYSVQSGFACTLQQEDTPQVIEASSHV